MTNKCDTFVLNKFGKWINEEDWYWKPAETTRLDEDDDLEGELSSEDLRAVAGPVARFYHAITTPSAAPSKRYENRTVERESLIPLAEYK